MLRVGNIGALVEFDPETLQEVNRRFLNGGLVQGLSPSGHWAFGILDFFVEETAVTWNLAGDLDVAGEVASECDYSFVAGVDDAGSLFGLSLAPACSLRLATGVPVPLLDPSGEFNVLSQPWAVDRSRHLYAGNSSLFNVPVVWGPRGGVGTALGPLTSPGTSAIYGVSPNGRNFFGIVNGASTVWIDRQSMTVPIPLSPGPGDPPETLILEVGNHILADGLLINHSGQAWHPESSLETLDGIRDSVCGISGAPVTRVAGACLSEGHYFLAFHTSDGKNWLARIPSIQRSPLEVGPMLASKPETVTIDLQWENLSTEDTYDVIRGDLTSSFSSASCLKDDTSSNSIQDSELPLTGKGFYYLVRMTNPQGDGTFGGNYSAVTRPSLESACPL